MFSHMFACLSHFLFYGFYSCPPPPVGEEQIKGHSGGKHTLETGGPSPHLKSVPGMQNVGSCWHLAGTLTAVLGHLEKKIFF